MPLDSFSAGAIAGTCAAIATLPLERIKTIYQSSLKGEAVGSVRATVRAILKQEGARGLFRGIIPTVAGVAPARSVYFGAYSNVKGMLSPSDDEPGALVHLLSAGAAGFTTATAIAPVFMVKTRMQLMGEVSGAAGGVVATTRAIYKEGGLRAFYRGLSASYLGISETVIQFVVYEKLKRMAQNASASGPSSAPAAQLAAAEWRNAAGDGEADLEVGGASSQTTAAAGAGGGSGGSGGKDFSLWHAFGCGATAKLIASCLSYPHEVVRTRLREHHSDPAANSRSIVGWLREIGAKEGVRGLYGGLGVHLLRTVPNAAILFVVVEALAGDI